MAELTTVITPVNGTPQMGIPAYTRTTWAKGDALSAAKLNNIESGISGFLNNFYIERKQSDENDKNLATTGYVWNAISSLHSYFPQTASDLKGLTTNSGVNKTLTALNIDAGKIVGMTFEDITIQQSQVQNLSTTLNTLGLGSSSTIKDGQNNEYSQNSIERLYFSGTVKVNAPAEDVNDVTCGMKVANKAYVDSLTVAANAYNANNNPLATVATVNNTITSAMSNTILYTFSDSNKSDESKTITLTPNADYASRYDLTFNDIKIKTSQISDLGNTTITKVTTVPQDSTLVTLEPDTKYRLTAGNTSIYFQTPAINSTFTTITIGDTELNETQLNNLLNLL